MLKRNFASDENTFVTLSANNEESEEDIIILVDQLLQEAINKQASDIHIEPNTENYRIRFRCDGLLYAANPIASSLGLRISTRLKVMANLNIAEKRLPQDGRFTFHSESLDVRLSTCPTLFGEKIVLRIFQAKQIPIELSQLGMSTLQLMHFLHGLQQPQGLILVTGPTGSGKTITLYSALQHLNRVEKNICTAEDPIEMELTGINQLHVNQRIGLDFITALKHFLRQDPDVIMVGEIRDVETAQVAMHAAQTGHLVLSTLHTNSAVDTIFRLKALGISTHDVANTISLIIAQRLIRKLCANCKGNFKIAACSFCHEGFQGRTGIFEVVPISKNIATLINQANPHSLLQHIRMQKIALLHESGIEKIEKGITTNEEIARVLGMERD